MSEDNRVLTMSPLVFVFVCLASMNVLGEPEEQPIKLEQGSLVLFHTVLVFKSGTAVVCFSFSLFSLNHSVGSISALHVHYKAVISHHHHTGQIK